MYRELEANIHQVARPWQMHNFQKKLSAMGRFSDNNGESSNWSVQILSFALEYKIKQYAFVWEEVVP